ncbi:MAG: efflux RND transporter permease subunit [Pseudomonadales bacterium]
MNVTSLSVRHKAAVSVAMGLLCVFGYGAVTGLPLQLLPDIESPRISIYNNWRSAAPQEIEEAIVQPQEEMLRFNAGLDNIISDTSRGGGQITLNYQLGYDMKQAMLDVINRLNQAPSLPIDAGEPFVASGGGGLPGAASILVYAGPDNPVRDMIVYQDLIEEVVEPRLARIPGVAQVNLNGRRPKEVTIAVDPLTTALKGLQVSDIANALARARDVSGGFADVGRRRYTVRFLGEQDISQLGRLVVGYRNDQPIYLEEVATVKVDYAENNSVTLRSGFPSYYISIDRRNDANTVKLLDELNEALIELNSGPLSKANVIIELSFDASLHIRRAINLVQGNLLLGLLLATLILYYFLRNFRATIAITLTVPVALLVAFIALDVLGLTLNVISLAGLAFAVGLVMDAAIVVQENIFRLRQSGMNIDGAVTEGTRQVRGALFSSTLTTVAIFVPILFMVGIEGQLFKDLAITISVAVVASMLAAITVLPAITSGWVKSQVAPDRFSGAWDRLAGFVVRVTDKRTARLGWIIGIFGVAVIAIWLLVPKVDFLPRANIDAISVFFNLPAGMNQKTIETELAPEVVARLAPYLSGEAHPRIRAYNFASFNGFATQVYIYPESPEEVEELVQKLRSEILAGLPDVTAFVRQASMLRVDNGGARGIYVDIQGSDLPTLLAAARKGQEVISELWEGTNVYAQAGLGLDEPELRITPNDRMLSAAGIDRPTLGSAVRAYTGGLFAGEYFDGNQRMDMIIRSGKWTAPDELLNLPVWTPGAGVQAIGDLSTIKRAVGPTNLQRVNGRRTVTLTVTPPDHVTMQEALARLSSDAEPAIKAMLAESGSVKYRGNADRLKHALGEVFNNFLLAILMLFMIMAAMFKSLRDSLLVLMVMPLALAGGLAALRLLNLVSIQSLDLLTMIGFIILLGLVVNNAILLVYQARTGEALGLSTGEAVAQAISYRARPIFMSSLTSVFGMMPLMLMPGVGSEIYRGLATVIVGGITVSTLFTLILLPALLRLKWPARLAAFHNNMPGAIREL